MSDLISRQAAIDAIYAEARLANSEVAEEYAKMYAYALKGLPSAQPDHNADTGKMDTISREYLKEHIEACWMNGRPRHAPELTELLSWIDDVPSAKPERDIPKKPNETTDRTWGIPHRQAVCPNCDRYIGTMYFLGEGKRKISYCDSCGQAIDWSDWRYEDE